MPNGNRAFVFSKDIKPAPNNFYPETFLQIFDPQWNQIGSTVLYIKNTYSSGYLLRVDGTNNLYLYFSDSGLSKLSKFDSQLNLVWCKYLAVNFVAGFSNMLVRPQNKGVVLVSYEFSKFETGILNVDENGNDANSKRIQNFTALDIDF